MTKDEESAFRRWWCNYEITRKEKSEIVAKDAFHAGVSALMLVKQTLENDNAILRKRNAEIEQKNAELEKALTITQQRYFPLQDKFIKTREILEDILRLLTIYKISDADKKYLERAENFLRGK